jgi:tRNA threonylcarbamoyladenosine biosynthesis protein TsaB
MALKILALDTATEACSAAVWIDGRLWERELETERGHADLILALIDELLRESRISLGDVDAIAFGRGPGSFTGVRLAASITQGLAFGVGIPVVPISDLRAVAQRVVTGEPRADVSGQHISAVPPAGNHVPTQISHQPGSAPVTPRVLVCNDARMQEVYWGCFAAGADGLMLPVGAERVTKPSEVHLPDEWRGAVVSGAGRGFAAYPELHRDWTHRLASIELNALPRSREIAWLAVAEVRAGRVLPAEQAVPVYVRDEVAKPKLG